MSTDDKTHADMVAAVAANYAKEASAATQEVIRAIEAVRDAAPAVDQPCSRCETLMAENYKLVTKVSELRVAIEFLRSQKP